MRNISSSLHDTLVENKLAQLLAGLKCFTRFNTDRILHLLRIPSTFQNLDFHTFVDFVSTCIKDELIGIKLNRHQWVVLMHPSFLAETTLFATRSKCSIGVVWLAVKPRSTVNARCRLSNTTFCRLFFHFSFATHQRNYMAFCSFSTLILLARIYKR